MKLIAATVLTGFLGSGKSTLLRRLLTEAHGRKIAVIENEFGEENIDSEIIVSGGQEQIVVMSNGCVCCSIRDDLRATLWDLAEQRNAGELDFDAKFRGKLVNNISINEASGDRTNISFSGIQAGAGAMSAEESAAF